MIKPSRRAVVIAASFALGLSCVGPYAHAGLLDGGEDSPSVEGFALPVGGDVVGDLLGGDLLGGDLLGGDLRGGDLLGGDLLGGVVGDDLLGGVVGGDLLGGDLLGGDLLGDVLGGEAGGLVAAEAVVDLVPELGFVPGLGSVSEILEAFSGSGSIVPGLQVLDEFGVLGILGSL